MRFGDNAGEFVSRCTARHEGDESVIERLAFVLPIKILGLGRKKISHEVPFSAKDFYLLLGQSDALRLHDLESLAFDYALDLLSLANCIGLDNRQRTLKWFMRISIAAMVTTSQIEPVYMAKGDNITTRNRLRRHMVCTYI